MSTSTETPDPTPHRPPFWRDVRVIRIALQVTFLVVVASLLFWLYDNLSTNLRNLGIRRDLAFLDFPAGFPVVIGDFRAIQPIRELLVVGFVNILRVAIPGVLIALALGVVVGIGRLSQNWLVRKTASIYVEVLRNVPPLVLLVFFYIAVITQLPGPADAAAPGGLMVLSNRGLYLPGPEVQADLGLLGVVTLVALAAAFAVGRIRTRRFEATGEPHHRIVLGAAVLVVIIGIGWLVLGRPLGVDLPVRDGRSVTGGWRMWPEYAAVLIALVLYTASFIAEIVRGSIQAVHLGQSEAANALGLSGFQRLRFVILPQALRIATPALGNEFLNLSKNVSLGVFVAYPELLRVSRQAIGNGQPAPQLLGLALVGYLTISLGLSLITNVANRRLQLAER